MSLGAFWGSIVNSEKEADEIVRLRQEQTKARGDEVFGGFSLEERAKYDERKNRIHELEQRISKNEEPSPHRRRLHPLDAVKSTFLFGVVATLSMSIVENRRGC